MRRSKGFTLVEVLVGVIVTGVAMSALLTGFIVMFKAQASSVNMPANQIAAQQIATSLAEAFRGAVTCGSTDSGCTLNAQIQNASSTGCTIYSRNSSGTLVQTTYQVVNGNFEETVGSTTTVLYSNATISLTYYTSSTQYASSLTTFTPSSTTSSTLIAVKIVATVSSDATKSSTYTEGNTYTTMVRLRNG